MKGVSEIDEQQIKHMWLRTKACHYRAMAAAIEAHDDAAIAGLPKYHPQGRPVNWYPEHAVEDQRASQTAGELGQVLAKVEHGNGVQRLTSEQA